MSEPAMPRAGRLGDGWIVSFAAHLLAEEVMPHFRTEQGGAGSGGRDE